MPRLRFARALLAFAFLGCSADQTAILLEIESPNLIVPTDIAQVRIVATGETGVMADVTSDLPGTWPQTFAIRPGAGRGDELVSIRVYGLAGGRERIRRVLAPVRFVRGETTPVSVILTRDCLDVVCTSPDVGCLAGMCTDGMVPDGGVDAGMMDGGILMDAGEDAGVDGGEGDGGTDGGVDVDGGVDAGPPGEGQLLFTEYVEGSSNNKALEITNVGTGTADLSGCVLNIYTNGATTVFRSDPLSGTLAPGATLSLCNAAAEAALLSRCDRGSSAIAFNGNDAMELVCSGASIDVFGSIGPTHMTTTAWGTAPTVTADATLRRKCTVTMGDVDGTDAFDPSVEWDGFANNTFDDVGMRVCP